MFPSGAYFSEADLLGPANVEAEYALSAYLSASATSLHFFPGWFLRETPPDRAVTFTAAWRVEPAPAGTRRPITVRLDDAVDAMDASGNRVVERFEHGVDDSPRTPVEP